MEFLIGLVIAVIFVMTCDKPLKKHPGAFYIAAVVLAVIAAGCTYAGVTGGFSIWFSTWVWPLIARGVLGSALFVIVMYTGALPNGSAGIKKLMPIRGEISIIASILILGHNFTYGKTYFVMLFTQTSMLSTAQLLACIASIVMICIMIPLFITSFKSVRRKMSAKSWKKLQRFAYIFYALMYVHTMLLSVPMYMRGITSYMVNIIAYTVVFGVYAVMRIRKAAAKKHAAAARKQAAV